jgi:hypothetical protein
MAERLALLRATQWPDPKTYDLCFLTLHTKTAIAIQFTVVKAKAKAKVVRHPEAWVH